MDFKEIVVSGIRPTAYLHLGNYFGAVKQFLRLQQQYDCYFFIADYHSLTTHPDAKELKHITRQVLIEYLASGLDPEKAVLYLQSDLPQIPEFYLVLNMYAYLGELEKVPTFKEKVRAQPENVNAGLLTYPVLMAADILMHKGTLVPVGKDQEQHLEMTRNFAKRFNNAYGKEVLPEPQPLKTGKTLVKVPALDGSGKMSASGNPNNAIFLKDDPKVIRKKVMRAVTDAGPTAENQPKTEEVQNLFDLLELVSTPETVQHFEEAYAKATIRYGDLKKQLAEDAVQFVQPIQERIAVLEQDDAYLERVLKQGAEKARASAEQTLQAVREAIGLGRRN